jgi:putative ATP-binding cassette transporter
MKIFNEKKFIAVLIILLLIDCAMGGYIAIWREGYWSSLEHKQFLKWGWYIAQFIGLALASCAVSGYSQYITNIVSLNIRTRLTRKALKLDNYGAIEGGGQRIQEDCMSYPSLLINLSLGLVRAFIMIGIYCFIIIKGIGLVWLLLPVGYALVGTLLAGKIAFPLIKLNYLNQVVEAKFRQILTKLNYVAVHKNNYNMFIRSKYLQYFQSFYNQITVIVPHLLLATLYFTGKITFGIFMQVASSIAELINSLSYLLNSFGDINRFLSCRKRLKELKII